MHQQFLQDIAQNEINSIDYVTRMGQALSTESRGQAFMDTVSTSFATFFDNVMTFLNGLKTENYVPVKLDLAAAMRVSSLHYSTLRGTTLSVPAGFKGRYTDYLSLVGPLLESFKQLDEVLEKSAIYMAKVLADPEILKAQTPSKDIRLSFPSGTLASPEAMTHYKKFFENGRIAEAKFGDVFSRAGDFRLVVELVQNFNHQLAKIDFASINKRTARLVELGKRLADLLRSDEYRAISGISVTSFSDFSYSLATTISLASLVTFNMAELTKCLVENTAEIQTA